MTKLWKIYFIARAENGIAQSNHFKIEDTSPVYALLKALSHVEKHFNVRLMEIESASVKAVTQEVWDTADGYVVLHD